MNEHVDKIIDLRRYLVLTEGKMDSDAQRAMTSIERQGNPWGLNRKERENWRDAAPDAEIPTVKEMKKEGKEFEYLFWVGSMGSYDNRSQKIAISFAKLLNHAGVSFAILGNKEKIQETRRAASEMNFYSKSWLRRISLNLKKIMWKKSLRSIRMHTIYLKMSILISVLKARFIIIQKCWPSW